MPGCVMACPACPRSALAGGRRAARAMETEGERGGAWCGVDRVCGSVRPSQEVTPRGRKPEVLVRTRQALVVGPDHVAALGFRNGTGELGERLGEQPVAAVAVEPVEFGAPHEEDAQQDQFADAVGLRLRIGKSKRRSPRAAKDLPALDIEMAAQGFNVGQEIPGRVVFDRGVGERSSTAALIEQDDAIELGVVEAAHDGRGAGARSTG